LSNIVLVNIAFGFSLLAFGQEKTSTISPPPWWIWVKPTAKGQWPKAAFSNPMFGAKRLALNRDTESVVVLTPNIKLVELTGIEPVASWLQTRRSPS
jgi:hypothetical protein